MTDLQSDIRQQLHELDPRLDLLALERPRTDALRLFIDHPDGVDLALCERVTGHLRQLLNEYSLEVSSPGPKHRGGADPVAVSEEPSSRSEPAYIPDSSPASEGEPREVP
jgi:putative ribosome maturation factor RimP